MIATAADAIYAGIALILTCYLLALWWTGYGPGS